MEMVIVALLQLLGIFALISVMYLIYAFFQSRMKHSINKKLVWVTVVVLAAYVLLTIVSVVMISYVASSRLGEARQKANEAGMKANLSSLSIAGVLYFDTNKSYSGFCNDAASLASVKAKLTAEEQNDYVCNDSATQWAASISLGSSSYLCIDNVIYQPIEIKSALKDQTACQK